MADKFITLLELTKRAGTDAAVGLVEEVTTYAPEINLVTGRVINGISYKARVRTALNDKGAFRKVNEGVEIGSSAYERKQFDCFFFDTQLQVDEATLGATGEGDSEAELLADEAASAVAGKMIAFGKQFYKGTANDPNGHPGLIDFLNSGLVVDATGTGATTYRAWFLWMHPRGIHFIFGRGRGLNLGDWKTQQVTDAAGKKLTAWVNNLSGYVGLSCAHTQAVGCIKNLTSAKPLTDALGAEMISKFPLAQKPNLCLVERNSAFWLQKSRSATVIQSGQKSSTGQEVSAPFPTSIEGVPLYVTDSITSEAAS